MIILKDNIVLKDQRGVRHYYSIGVKTSLETCIRKFWSGILIFLTINYRIFETIQRMSFLLFLFFQKLAVIFLNSTRPKGFRYMNIYLKSYCWFKYKKGLFMRRISFLKLLSKYIHETQSNILIKIIIKITSTISKINVTRSKLNLT